MFKVELSLPLHAQEVVVCGVHGVESEGTFDVNFGHLCPTPHAHDGVDGIAHCGVAEREISIVDTIIDTVPWRVGKVHNEASFAWGQWPEG